MSDDWKAGDLALCLKVGPWTRSGMDGPRGGHFYTVDKMAGHDFFGRLGFWLVGFEETFCAFRFRKIRPHTPDAEDRETIRLLTGKPVKEPSDA